MYDFNTTEDDSATVYGFEVDRDPGQEFHVDYSASYGVTPAFRLGINGYYYYQTSDDSYELNDSIPAPVQELLRADGIITRICSLPFVISGKWVQRIKPKDIISGLSLPMPFKRIKP